MYCYNFKSDFLNIKMFFNPQIPDYIYNKAYINRTLIYSDFRISIDLNKNKK